MPVKRIFAFWEPRGAMPGYLKLCVRTWRKFLPDHDIVVLEYADLDQWPGKDCYAPGLYANFSLPKQSDAVNPGDVVVARTKFRTKPHAASV